MNVSEMNCPTVHSRTLDLQNLSNLALENISIIISFTSKSILAMKNERIQVVQKLDIDANSKMIYFCNFLKYFLIYNKNQISLGF